MTLTNINKKNNTFVLETSSKTKQQYYFTFFLNNQISLKTLGLFFHVKQKYAWLLQTQKLNLIEGHAFVDLNHLNFDLKIQSSLNTYRYEINVNFLNFELEEKFVDIQDFINTLFLPINLKLLNDENINVLKNHVIGYLKSEKFSYNDVEILKNQHLNETLGDISILFDQEGYNRDLYNLNIEQFSNDFKVEILNIDFEFLNNVKSFKQMYRVCDQKYIVDLTKIFEFKDCVSNEVFNYDLQIQQTKEYKFKDYISTSELYILFKYPNTIKEKLIFLYFNDLIWNFYFDVIREKHQLIYSPEIKTLSIDPSIIKVSNSTQNANLNKLMKLESQFFANITNFANEINFNNFKKNLLSELENSFENLDLNFYYSLAYYYNNFNDDYYNIVDLECWYKKQVNNLSFEDILNNEVSYKQILKQITKGE